MNPFDICFIVGAAAGLLTGLLGWQSCASAAKKTLEMALLDQD